MQRGVDTAAELSDVVAQKLSAVADPRAKLLRKRRWALRLAVFFTVACVFWALVAVVMASWTVPAWALLIPGLIAAGAAFPATLLFLRYRWLRAAPLPPARDRDTRRLPPWGSAARAPMAALADSERGLFSLLGVVERGRLLPAEEVRDITGAARRTATTMAATAREVVSMERAVQAAPQSRSQLVPTINAFSAQLGQGVRQYNEMVTAAAQLVAAANGGLAGSPMSHQRYRDELVGATDRLTGWAQAFDELGQLRRA